MKLYTSRWQNRALETAPVLAVGISRGVPRFPVRYRYHRIRELEPDGWMFGIKSDEKFEECYRRKLDRLGVQKMATRLQNLSDEEGGVPLVLLCYEDVHAGQVCHRRMFAEYWHEQTGQGSEELPERSLQRDNPQPTPFEEGR